MEKNLKNSVDSFKAAKAQLRKTASAEQSIHSIFESLTSVVSDEKVVTKEKAPKGGCCLGYICVYSRQHLQREEELRAAGYNPRKTYPEVRYAFYPSENTPGRIGSVAIYSDQPAALYIAIKRRGYLFNRPVIAASIRFGCRPFVDVKLAS